MKKATDTESTPRAQSAASIRERFRYQLDNSFSKGTAPLIGLLAIATLAVIIVAGSFLWLAHVAINGERTGGIEGMWLSLVRTLDPGTMGSDRGWRFRITSLVVTITGIFIVSTLIGILANGISQRLESLRRGRSRVIESGHVLVLGWSNKFFILLAELAEAHKGDKVPTIVVLADRDTVAMEEELRLAFDTPPRARVVFRSGHGTSPQALNLVAPVNARSIVILAGEDHNDSHAVHMALALEHVGVSSSTPIVLEVYDDRHARALKVASSLNLLPVVSTEWIAMITARAVQQPFLTAIYEDLLNFEGSEIYFISVPPDLIGQTVSTAAARLKDAAMLGIQRGDSPLIGIHPSEPLREADQLIVVAETSTSASLRSTASPISSTRSHSFQHRDPEQPIHLLILGWSDLGGRVLDLLDHSIPPNSSIDILTPGEHLASVPDHPFQRFTLRVTQGDPTNVTALERNLTDSTLTGVLVLSQKGPDGRHQDADALLTLLELRHLLDDRPVVRVTVEIGEPANADLVRVNHHEEFIVGERLVCLLMSQLSHTAGVDTVLTSLLTDDDSDIYTVTSHEIGVLEATPLAELAQGLMHHGLYVIGIADDRHAFLTPSLDHHELLPGQSLVAVASRSTLHQLRTQPATIG